MPALPQPSRKLALSISALSLLPHIFCCLLPTFVALVSLLATSSLAGGSVVGALSRRMAANPLYQVVDAWHPYLLALAVAGVAFSGILNLLALRQARRPHVHHHSESCHHGPCTPRQPQRQAWRLFTISCGLLVLDVLWFAFETLVLSRHQ